MGKLTCNIVASDTSVDEGVKTVHEKQKIRTKKKKRKRDLTDLKIFKLKTLAGIYRNGATGKEIQRAQTEVAMNDLNNARLQGNLLKLLDGYHSKSEHAATEKNNTGLTDFSIENILKPTHAETSPVLGKIYGRERIQKNEDIEISQRSIEENGINDSEQNTALNKYEELCSIVSSENFEGNNFPNCFGPDPLMKVKQKLRHTYAESFQNKLLRDTIIRGNILSSYSTSIPSTSTDNLLPWNAAVYPSTSNQNANSTVDSVDQYYINLEQNIENKNTPFLMPETNFKGNEITSSNLLFNLSSLNTFDARMKNSLEAEMLQKTSNISMDGSINLNNHTSLEVNPPATSTSANSNSVKYFETNEFEGTKEESKSVLFVQTEPESENSYNHKKYRSRRTQTVRVLSNGLEKDAEKQNLKILQQIKMKNLKHIPIILRRCNNVATNNNNQLNLFQESMHTNKEPQEMLFNAASRQNVLFTSQSLTTESNDNSQRLQRSTTLNTLFDTSDIENLQTCVIQSPCLRNDDIYFVKNSFSQPKQNQPQSQNFHVNSILVNKKNPSVQKTVMFTKKDSRNVGHCLHLNNTITDETTDNSNICIIRKNVSSQYEKLKNNCTTHKNCQEVPKSYKTYQCTQSFDNSNCSNQEFEEISIPQHQKSQICEMLAKKVQQHSKCENNKTCYDDQHVCYVMINQCKDSNNVQECSHDVIHQIEKSRKLQNSSQELNQEDVTIKNINILKGVKNLKILPIKKRSQMKFIDNQSIKNAVVVNEQPTKYLAFENDSECEKVPVYLQSSEHVADNIKVIDPNNHRISCPQESMQKIIFVPTCKQNKVVYIKQQNLPHSNIAFEECSHPRKLVLYRPEVECVKDDSNVCSEVYVPKQNVMEIRKIDNDTIITNPQQTDNMKKSTQSGTNWEEFHQSNYDTCEHDTCEHDTRNQAIFYQK
ncbi:hypothetical protein WN51_14503 [Melipona quadrifasciata]|uniref:Uncharacterized protein n=1 Tax=Melipona quadrifasciata TaxID=166423 RepID=A0A0M8ZYD9_9HYME|nr:hypothetical protein WN51_14503 [Melipona quadrifasciata]